MEKDKDIFDVLFDILTENYNDEIDKNKDLEEYLQEKDVKELLYIYLTYGYATNMTDEEIEEKLQYLNNEEKATTIQEIIKLLDKNFYKILEFLNEERFESAKNIAKNDDFSKFNRGEPGDVSFDTLKILKQLGFIFVRKENDNLVIHMPDYIKNKINKIEKCLYLDLYDEIIKYSIGIANTYGAIRIEDAYNIVKRDIDVSKDKYISVIEIFSLLELQPIFYSISNQAICNYNLDEEDIDIFLEKYRKYVIYDKEFYENMENDKYLFSLTEYRQFRNYLKENYWFDINDEELLRGEIIIDYIDMCQIDKNKANEYVKEAIDRYFDIEDEIENNIIISYVEKIRTKMPNWKNGGKIETNKEEIKIGRNQKCPCRKRKKI